MVICSMESRKVTQLSAHSSWPVLPATDGPSAQLDQVSCAQKPWDARGPLTPTTALLPPGLGDGAVTWHLDTGQQVRPSLALRGALTPEYKWGALVPHLPGRL